MPPTPAGYFGEQVRATRRRKGWTQDDLSARLAELGAPMHPTAITKIEKGNRNVSVDEAFAIATALDVSPLSLLLPRDDQELVAIAPAAGALPANAVRSWIEGSLPITAFVLEDLGDGSTAWQTLDGKRLDDPEAAERKRFYQSEVSTNQWRIRQIPGLAHLAEQLRAYERARIEGADRAILRSHLASIAAEVDRQQAEVEREDN